LPEALPRSLSEQVDTSTPTGNRTLQLRGFLAAFRKRFPEFWNTLERRDTAFRPQLLAARRSLPCRGAVAELEGSLIVERVKAGLRNARAKGKRLGRPPGKRPAIGPAEERSTALPRLL